MLILSLIPYACSYQLWCFLKIFLIHNSKKFLKYRDTLNLPSHEPAGSGSHRCFHIWHCFSSRFRIWDKSTTLQIPSFARVCTNEFFSSLIFNKISISNSTYLDGRHVSLCSWTAHRAIPIKDAIITNLIVDLVQFLNFVGLFRKKLIK